MISAYSVQSTELVTTIAVLRLYKYVLYGNVSFAQVRLLSTRNIQFLTSGKFPTGWEPLIFSDRRSTREICNLGALRSCLANDAHRLTKYGLYIILQYTSCYIYISVAYIH